MSDSSCGTTDEATLSAFLQSSPTVSAEQATSVIRRITPSIFDQPGPSAALAKLASNVLNKIYKSPCPGVLADILPACEHEPPDVVHVFVLCTAAAKAVTVSAIIAAKAGQLSIALGLRVVRNFCRSALVMLLKMSAQALHTTVAASKAMANRCVKVVLFYFSNIIKCLTAFLPAFKQRASSDENHDGDETAGADGVEEMYTDLLSYCLRLSAFITYLIHTHENVLPSPIFSEFKTGMAPLLSKILPTVLSLPSVLFPGKSLESVICKPIENCSSTEALTIKYNPSSSSSPVVDPPLMRLLALLHLMRFTTASTSTSERSRDSTQQSNESSFRDTCSKLKRLFHSLLCRLLFTTLDASYDSLATIRDSHLKAPLFRSVSNALSAVFIAHASGTTTLAEDVQTMRNSFMVEMSAVNALRAMFAADGLVALFNVWIRASDHAHLENAVQLLYTTAMCGRRASALRSSHTQSRWIPLLTRLFQVCIDSPDVLFRTLVSSQISSREPSTNANGPPAESDALRSDSFALLLLAQLLHATPSGSAASEWPRTVLRAFHLGDHAEAQQWLTRSLAQSSGTGDLTEAMLSLAPVLLGGEAATADALHSFLTRARPVPLSAACVVAAANGLRPGHVPPRVAAVLRDGVRRHGVLVCVSVCRALPDSPDVTELCMRSAAAHDAVLGATAFRVAPGVCEALTRRVPSIALDEHSTVTLVRERRALQLEKAACAKGRATPQKGEANRKTNVALELRRAREAVTATMQQHPLHDDAAAELEALRVVVACGSKLLHAPASTDTRDKKLSGDRGTDNGESSDASDVQVDPKVNIRFTRIQGVDHRGDWFEVNDNDFIATNDGYANVIKFKKVKLKK